MAYDNPLAGHITLTEGVYRSHKINVGVERGVLKLRVLDLRNNDPTSPAGLPRFRDAKFSAPVCVLPGNFKDDSQLAQDWLAQHRAW